MILALPSDSEIQLGSDLTYKGTITCPFFFKLMSILRHNFTHTTRPLSHNKQNTMKRGCAGSGPSTCMSAGVYCITASLAHAIHARFLRLEDSMALLPPLMPRAPLSSSELHIVDSLG